MDRLEQLYKLYLANGIITSQTSFDQFKNSDSDIQTKLHEMGKTKGLFNTTDLETFQTAWSDVKKKEPGFQSSVQEYQEDGAVEREEEKEPDNKVFQSYAELDEEKAVLSKELEGYQREWEEFSKDKTFRSPGTRVKYEKPIKEAEDKLASIASQKNTLVQQKMDARTSEFYEARYANNELDYSFKEHSDVRFRIAIKQEQKGDKDLLNELNNKQVALEEQLLDNFQKGANEQFDLLDDKYGLVREDISQIDNQLMGLKMQHESHELSDEERKYASELSTKREKLAGKIENLVGSQEVLLAKNTDVTEQNNELVEAYDLIKEDLIPIDNQLEELDEKSKSQGLSDEENKQANKLFNERAKLVGQIQTLVGLQEEIFAKSKDVTKQNKELVGKYNLTKEELIQIDKELEELTMKLSDEEYKYYSDLMGERKVLAGQIQNLVADQQELRAESMMEYAKFLNTHEQIALYDYGYGDITNNKLVNVFKSWVYESIGWVTAMLEDVSGDRYSSPNPTVEKGEKVSDILNELSKEITAEYVSPMKYDTGFLDNETIHTVDDYFKKYYSKASEIGATAVPMVAATVASGGSWVPATIMGSMMYGSEIYFDLKEHAPEMPEHERMALSIVTGVAAGGIDGFVSKQLSKSFLRELTPDKALRISVTKGKGLKVEDLFVPNKKGRVLTLSELGKDIALSAGAEFSQEVFVAGSKLLAQDIEQDRGHKAYTTEDGIDMLDAKTIWNQLKESAFMGGYAGLLIGGMGKIITNQSLANFDLINELHKKPKLKEAFDSQLDLMLKTGEITKEQHGETKKMVNSTIDVIKMMPKDIANSKAFSPETKSLIAELITKRNKITKENIEGKDPNLAKPYKEEVDAINKEIEDLAKAQKEAEADPDYIAKLEEQEEATEKTTKEDIEKRRQEELKEFELINRAREGDKEAQATLEEYGLDYKKQPIYRYVSQSEIDALNNGETIQGKFKNGRVDVTTNEQPSTGSSAEYRITFKDKFDYNKGGKAQLKNEDSGDGWIFDGYTKDDVYKIEKRNEDGSYETVYQAENNQTIEGEINANSDAELAALEGKPVSEQDPTQPKEPEQATEKKALIEPRFKLNEKLILSDNTEWTVVKVFDTRKIKDKLYHAFNMGSIFNYDLKRELSGSIISMKEKALIKNLKKQEAVQEPTTKPKEPTKPEEPATQPTEPEAEPETEPVDVAELADVARISKSLKKVFPDVEVVINQKVWDEIEPKKKRKKDLFFPGTFDSKGRVLYNPRKVSKETPFHEFGHTWVAALRQKNKPLYEKFVELVQNTALQQEAIETHGDIVDGVLSNTRIVNDEAIVTALGKKGLEMFEDKATQTKFQKLWNEFLDWLRDVFGLSAEYNFENATLDDLLNVGAKALTKGKRSKLIKNRAEFKEVLEGEFDPATYNEGEVIQTDQRGEPTVFNLDAKDPKVQFAIHTLANENFPKTGERPLDGRINYEGLRTSELRQAQRNLAEGKESKALQKVLDVLMGMHERGMVDVIQGRGGQTNYTGVSIDDWVKADPELHKKMQKPIDARFQAKKKDSKPKEFTSNALASVRSLPDDYTAGWQEWMGFLNPKKAPKPGYVKGTSTDVKSMGLEDVLKEYQKQNKVKRIPKNVVEDLIKTNLYEMEMVVLSNKDVKQYTYEDFEITKEGDRLRVNFPDKHPILGYGYSNISPKEYENNPRLREDIIKGALRTQSYRNLEHYLSRAGRGKYATHYEEFTIPGGKNYREFLIQDASEENMSISEHYGRHNKNIITTVRVDDRVGANGEKILFVQEIQSDLVQRTKKEDFKTKEEINLLKSQLSELESKIKLVYKKRDEFEVKLDEKIEDVRKSKERLSHYYSVKRVKWLSEGQYKSRMKHLNNQLSIYNNKYTNNKYNNEAGEIVNRINDIAHELGRSKIWQPWSQTDLWVGLTIRKLINQASKEGYDQIAFVNGVQSDIVQEHKGNEKEGNTHKFYDKVVPKIINKELNRLVKGVKHGVSSVEGGKNPTIFLTPDLKQKTEDVGAFRFQAKKKSTADDSDKKDEKAERVKKHLDPKDLKEKERYRAMFERYVNEDDFSEDVVDYLTDKGKKYIQKTNEVTVAEAKAIVEKLGVDGATHLVVAGALKPRVQVGIADEILNIYEEQVKQETDEKLIDKINEKHANLLEIIGERGTDWGGGTQAFRLFGHMGERHIVKILEKQLERKLTPEEKKKFQKLAKKVEDAPPGSQKAKAVNKLAKEMLLLEDIDKFDLIQSIWYASVLSAFKTQQRNLTGNIYMLTISQVEQMVNDPKEWWHSLPGMKKGAIKGWDEMKNVLKTGESPVRPTDYIKGTTEQANKYAYDTNIFEVIGQKGGRLKKLEHLKWVGRTLLAMDALASNINAEQRYYQLAYRQVKEVGNKDVVKSMEKYLNKNQDKIKSFIKQAKEEGLEGRDARRRVYDLVSEGRPQKFHQDAYDHASTNIYTNEPYGLLGVAYRWYKAGGRAAGKGIAGKAAKMANYVVPFVRIVSNVTNAAIDYTPWGVARRISGRQGVFGGKKLNSEERAKLLIRSSFGMLFSGFIWGLAEEEFITITAHGTGDQEKNYQLMEGGKWMPHTISVGSWHFSYRDSPLFFALAGVGAIMDYKRFGRQDEEGELTFFKGLGVYATGMVNSAIDSSWLINVSEMLETIKTENMKRGTKFGRIASNITKPFFMPPLLTEIARTAQEATNTPMKRQRGILENIYRDVPILNEGLSIIYNSIGEPVVSRGAYKLLPFAILKSKENEEVERLNAMLLFIGSPQRGRIIDMGDGMMREMTDKEYDAFAAESGRRIFEYLTADKAIEITDLEEEEDLKERVTVFDAIKSSIRDDVFDELFYD